MRFASAIFFFVCTPSVVHSINVLSGSDITGTIKDKALMFAQEIAGRGVTIIDAKFDLCDDDQIGLFTNAGTELAMGFENGVVLSSGFATDVVGLNNNQYSEAGLSHIGYAALDTLISPNGGATKDACVLHITFNCQDDEHFGMQFVFGSDNYDCPVHPPYTTAYEDVMGIFVQDDKTLAQPANIGLYNGKYISVDTFTKGSAPKKYIDNCLGNIPIEMNGYSYPITIDNSLNKVVTGTNELWIAVADGYDQSHPKDPKSTTKPSWLFVRRHSLVCIDKPASNAKTGNAKCATDALNACGGAAHFAWACDDWSCLDHHIQTVCVHPGTTQADHHNYKHSVHQTIHRMCSRLT